MLEVQYIGYEEKKWAIKTFGEGPIEMVIEMGLGACMGEWYQLAEKLGKTYSVLLYERLGIDLSGESRPQMARTPENIARELGILLDQLQCQKQLILIGHSQGGLYVQQFARLFPERIKGLIFLDPLSPKDHTFNDVLSAEEYQKSGVDKSNNFKIMRNMAKWHLGFLIRLMMKSAPPFYYYKGFSKDATKNILQGISKQQFSEIALEEYLLAHDRAYVDGLKEKEDFPNVPLVLITHDREKAIEENMRFGNNSRAFAEKIEDMWQQLMREYLAYSDQSIYICATESTHFIHLQQPELIDEALQKISEIR